MINAIDTPIAASVRAQALGDITRAFRGHITRQDITAWEAWVDAKVKLIAYELTPEAAEEILAETLISMAR